MKNFMPYSKVKNFKYQSHIINIQSFSVQNITVDVLSCLKERHIDELFHETPFHIKVLFENKLFEWKSKMVTYSCLRINT